MTRSSPRVFVVVDPVQDYEESLRILGVHGSLAAAQVAVRGYRRRTHRPTGDSFWPLVDSWRDLEVQLWQGDRLLDTWTHGGPDGSRHRAGRWIHGGATPPP